VIINNLDLGRASLNEGLAALRDSRPGIVNVYVTQPAASACETR
jgi:hypothetical protein